MRKIIRAVALLATASATFTASAAPELVHRWSFNGDYNDSIGGTSATPIGSSVGFNDGNTAVVLSGNGCNTGSLNLGANMLPSDVPEVTVEIWATQTAVRKWARILDYGQNNQNYFTMAWNQGEDANLERVEIKKANAGVFTCDNMTAAYTLNTPYHIAITFSVNANGSTSIRWVRRNTTSGAIERVGGEVAANWMLSDITSPQFYIGHSQYSTSDYDASAIYDEVRVWKGALTDEQLTASVLAGPDTLPDVGTPDPTLGTARWTGAVDDDATNAANWTPSAPDANTLAVFSGDFAAQIPSGASFTCAGVLFEDARLTADCDWRGLAAKIKGGNLDLAGNKLYVSDLDGEGLITEGGIPAEYQPVEYISSSGAQWLNTGFMPACTDRIEMKLNFNNKTGTQCLWCSRGTSTSTSTFTCFMISGNKLRFDRNTSTSGNQVLSPTAGADQTVVADGYTLKCTLDGNDAGTMAAGGFTPASPIVLFASHTAGNNLTSSTTMGNWASYRFINLKVYDLKGNLKCDFVPVRRIADGELGVYDRIGGTFAANMTATPFTAGADLTGASGVTGGELHVDVPSGAASVNEGVRISGSVKVFKEGAGSFTAKMPVSNGVPNKFVSGTLDIAGNKFVVDGLGGAGTITSALGNLLKNGNFEDAPVNSGEFSRRTPAWWRSSGSVYLCKNNTDWGYYTRNDSTWCFTLGTGYIYQNFTLEEDTVCTLSVSFATRGVAGGFYNAICIVDIDGVQYYNQTPNTQAVQNKTFYNIELKAGSHTIKLGCGSNYSNVGMHFDNVSLKPAGVLDVNVAEGETSDNVNVAITGGANMQVWKSGKGKLVMSKANGSFGPGGRRSGGVSLRVKEGVAKQTSSEGTASCGTQYSTVRVEDGAQFDLAGRIYHDYDFVLAGSGPDGSGALVNSGVVSNPWLVGGSNRAYLQDIRLSGDATLGGPEAWALLFYNYVAEHTLYMNGHTLSIKGVNLYGVSIAYSGAGRIVVEDDAMFELCRSTKTAPDCDFEVKGTLSQNGAGLTAVKSLVFDSTGTYSSTSADPVSFEVRTVYAPPTAAASGSAATQPTVTLGAVGYLETTLDISQFSTVFDGTTTTFYPGSELTVRLGSRTFTEATTKLVSWTAKPELTDLIADGENLEGISLGVTDDGLYAYKLNADRPATARWTGNGNVSNLRDPANWSCFNLYGDALANMAPTNFTTVVVDGRTTFSIPDGVTDFPWKNVQFGSTGPAATQWGRIYYGSDRSGFSNTSYLDYPLYTYTLRGVGDFSGLNGANTAWQASYLDLAQLRYDGWFYVTAAQAGTWHIRQKFDDYFGFAIDGKWVLTNPTYTVVVESDCEVTEGWHRFTIICGDTYGGQGSNGMTAGGASVPMAIAINGGTEIAFSAANFQMGSGSNVITLDGDCDWRALGRVHLVNGASVNLNGHKLKVANIDADADCLGSTVTSPLALDRTVTPPEVLNDAIFWLDASDASTLAVGSDGKVSTWTSKSSDGRIATASGVNPTYDTTTYGIPTVDFGDIASNKDMTYTRLTNIKTVFWVIKIEKAQRAFLLGDKNGGSGTYNFHRGTGGQYGNSSHAKFDRFWNGLYEVDWKNDYPEEDGFEVLCVKLTQNCCSDSLTYDRGTGVDSGARNGGRQLSELICFSRDLSDAERIAVTEYLQRKWKGKAPGELHIEVPQGESLVFNGNVSLAGNVQLVKEGAGLLTQSTVVRHVGGTHVAEGEFDMGCSRGIGRRGEVTIDEGTVFNMKSYSDFNGHLFVLNGGTFRNTGSDVGSGTAQLKYMLLTTNSTLDIQNNYGFIGNGYTRSILDLGGYTLTVNLNSGGKLFYLYNTEVRNGVLDVIDGGWLETGNAGVIATDATIKCRAAMRANGAVDVRDYVAYRETSKHNEGTAAFKVYGTFTPVTDIFYGCQMQNGSTVDLSARTTVWNTTMAPDDSAKGSTTVTFADGATVTIEFTAGRAALRQLLELDNRYVAKWTTETAPASTVKFVPSATLRSLGYRVQVESDGIKIEPNGFTIYLR